MPKEQRIDEPLSFSTTRDRLGQRLGELARLLSDPVNVPKVQSELNRLANG
jgi:hypothetical protein